MWNENPMKIYAKNHPGCSLQEYCEHLDREEQKRKAGLSLSGKNLENHLFI